MASFQTIEDDDNDAVLEGEMIRMEDKRSHGENVGGMQSWSVARAGTLLQDILDKTERRKLFLYEGMQ